MSHRTDLAQEVRLVAFRHALQSRNVTDGQRTFLHSPTQLGVHIVRRR